MLCEFVHADEGVEPDLINSWQQTALRCASRQLLDVATFWLVRERCSCALVHTSLVFFVIVLLSSDYDFCGLGAPIMTLVKVSSIMAFAGACAGLLVSAASPQCMQCATLG